jgi:hypothetical protein
MRRRLALVQALGVLACASTARAQAAPPVPPLSDETDASLLHPVFGVATVSGELGAHSAGGVKLGVFGTPVSSVSLGGAVFFAPIDFLPDTCGGTCNLHPLLFRAMGELRIGNPYTEYARGLGWLGVSAGVAYFAAPHIDPSPILAVAGGGDLRLGDSLWLELSPRITWTQFIGPGSTFAGTYFTLGLELGLRFDFAH